MAKGPVDATWPRRKQRRRSPRRGAGHGLVRRCGGRCGGAPRSHLSASPSPPRAGEEQPVAATGGQSSPRAGGRAGGGTERAQCGELRGARTRSEAARSPRPRALRSSRRVTRQSCFQAPGAPHPPAGGPAAVRFARASAPPASSLLPPSLRLPARTGRARGAVRGRRGGGKALLAPGSSACRGSGDVGSSAEKSRSVLGCGCSSSLSQWHTPQGRERAGGWRRCPRARQQHRVQTPPRRSSSLCPLFFYSPRFFPKGEKKPHNLRMCARVEIGLAKKK